MNRVGKRLLAAGLLALSLHTALLSWQLAGPPATLPTPLSCQQVTVSLGVREVARPISALKQNQPAVEGEKLPPSKPETRLHKQAPVKKPRPVAQKAVPARAQTQAIQAEQSLVQPPIPVTETPIEKRLTPASAAPSPQADIGYESAPASAAAARVIQQATPLYQINPPPKYPLQARRRSLEGVVMLDTRIDISGRVIELRLFTSSGHPVLDRAALKAVRSWRFTPGTFGGKRHEMWVKVPVRFQLQSTQ